MRSAAVLDARQAQRVRRWSWRHCGGMQVKRHGRRDRFSTPNRTPHSAAAVGRIAPLVDQPGGKSRSNVTLGSRAFERAATARRCAGEGVGQGAVRLAVPGMAYMFQRPSSPLSIGILDAPLLAVNSGSGNDKCWPRTSFAGSFAINLGSRILPVAVNPGS